LGSDLYAGHKVKNFFPAAEISSFRPVAPRDSVLLCYVMPPISFPSFSVSLP